MIFFNISVKSILFLRGNKSIKYTIAYKKNTSCLRHLLKLPLFSLSVLLFRDNFFIKMGFGILTSAPSEICGGERCFKIQKKRKDVNCIHNSLIIHLSFLYPLNCRHCNSSSLMLLFNHSVALGISLFNIVHYIIQLSLVIAKFAILCFFNN